MGDARLGEGFGALDDFVRREGHALGVELIERPDGVDVVFANVGVDVREVVAAAGFLPFEVHAEEVAVD
jgi:hypothetical protein